MCSDTKQISLSVKHNRNNCVMTKVVSSLSLFSSAVTGQLLWRRIVSCDCIAVHQDFAAAWEKCVMIKSVNENADNIFVCLLATAAPL